MEEVGGRGGDLSNTAQKENARGERAFS